MWGLQMWLSFGEGVRVRLIGVQSSEWLGLGKGVPSGEGVRVGGSEFRVWLGLESGSESELGLEPHFSVAGGRVHSKSGAQGKWHRESL